MLRKKVLAGTALSMLAPVAAFADDTTGSTGSSTTFDASGITSAFTSNASEVLTTVSGALPALFAIVGLLACAKVMWSWLKKA